VAIVALLLLLIAVSAASHLVIPPLCIILLPVFLFAMVKLEEPERLPCNFDCRLSFESEQASLFQRPPPLTLI
jgi:hypothetical protein